MQNRRFPAKNERYPLFPKPEKILYTASDKAYSFKDRLSIGDVDGKLLE